MSSPIILNGKKLADEICNKLKDRVRALDEKPKLTIITSGTDNAGKIYVRNKKRRCEEIGIECIEKHFESLDYYTASVIISTTNNPIIFQSPIVGYDVKQITNIIGIIKPDLDVDGFVSPINAAKLYQFSPFDYPVPCTPMGIMYLLDAYKIPVDRKTVCIIGRSNIVGRPLLHLMEQHGATPILCHTHTPKDKLCRLAYNSDIIVSATGVRNIIGIEDIHYSNFEDKILIDVGMNRDENGKLCGDFNPEAFKYCKAYTPVPGGVGPMTVAMLMKNVVDFYENKYYKYKQYGGKIC